MPRLGRPPGIKEKLPRKTRYREAVISGIALSRQFERTPLEVILGRMNGHDWAMELTPEQVSMAVAAAPYVHPKLNAVAFTETADASAERKRDALRNLDYHQRQEILKILAAAQQQQIEAVAEAIEDTDNGNGNQGSATDDEA